MTSDIDGFIARLTPEHIQHIEDLAGANYTPAEIAIYLGVNESEFIRMYQIPNSVIREHFDRGKLIAKAEIDMKLTESAKKGNITAAQLVTKIASAQNHQEFKRRLLYGY